MSLSVTRYTCKRPLPTKDVSAVAFFHAVYITRSLYFLAAQMILPRSHACKTLDNKYAEAERIHREAEKQRQQQAAEADQQEPNVEAWSGNSTSSTHGNSFDAADEQASRQGLKQSLDDSCRQGPLHAHHPEVVLLQVSSITIAAPADPTLLQQVHIDPAMRGQCLYTADPPLWMRDSAAVKQILANSRAIMICSGAPAHQQQNPVSSAADGATASTAMADPEVALNPSAGLAASQQLQQQLPRSLEDKKHVQFTVGRKQKPAAAVRHGVLLVTEDGVSEADLDAQLAPVPSFSVATAASRLWRQFVAKVQPRRSRLIVRPDNAEAFRAATGTAAVISGAAKSAASTSAFVAGLPAGQVPAGRADAAGGGGEDASGALLLLDFHGLELFAGKVLREQDTASWVSDTCCYVSTFCLVPEWHARQFLVFVLQLSLAARHHDVMIIHRIYLFFSLFLCCSGLHHLRPSCQGWGSLEQHTDLIGAASPTWYT